MSTLNTDPGPFLAADASTMSDAAALRDYARSGDPDAFAAIAGRYQAMVLATCRRLLRNDADAEDAAQETFLKLARGAGAVRTNVAAWLHRCATTTSLDLIRRADARRRAEHSAPPAESATASASDEALHWRELEPRIDRALDALKEADRALIVARYLSGRSQAELAREAQVSEGTVSRRLKRAMERLRRRLSADGVSVRNVALLGAALAGATTPSVSPAFAASLTKIGLAGAAGSAGSGATVGALSGGSSAWWLAGAAAALIGAGGVGLGVYTQTRARPAGPAGPTPAVALAAAANASAAAPADSGHAVPQPRRKPSGFEVVSAMFPGFEYSGVRIFEDRVVIFGMTHAGPARIVIHNENAVVQPDGSVIQNSSMGEMDLPPGVDPPFELEDGTPIRTRVDRHGRLWVEPAEVEDALIWMGVRPPAYMPEHAQIPDHPMLGPWVQCEAWPVEFDGQEISIGINGVGVVRYRVLDWEEADGYSRLQTICVDHHDPTTVGRRIKMLFRQTDSGRYDLGFFPMQMQRDDWPVSFEYSPEHPVILTSFVEADS